MKEQLRILPPNGFDYVVKGNPTIDVNPKRVPVTWLNLTTGEVFVCRDNMPGSNIWIGQRGTRVTPVTAISGLVAHWSMDRIHGQILVEEVSARNGTINGAISQAGKVGSSLYFNGSYVSVLADALFKFASGDFTLSFWAKGPAQSHRLMGNRDATSGWMVSMAPGTSTVWNQWTAAGAYASATGPAPKINDWSHISVRRSGDLVTVRVDVVDGTALNSTARPGATNSNLELGRDASSPTTTPLVGNLDEVRVYSRALTTQELTILYNEG